jgi:hypothetical protein
MLLTPCSSTSFGGNVIGFPNNWMPLSFGTSPENQSNAGGNFLWNIYNLLTRRLLNFIIFYLKNSFS